MLHPSGTEEVIPEVFVPGQQGGFIRRLLAGVRTGLVYFVLFSCSIRAGPGVGVCVFEVCTGSLSYESLTAQ